MRKHTPEGFLERLKDLRQWVDENSEDIETEIDYGDECVDDEYRTGFTDIQLKEDVCGVFEAMSLRLQLPQFRALIAKHHLPIEVQQILTLIEHLPEKSMLDSIQIIEDMIEAMQWFLGLAPAQNDKKVPPQQPKRKWVPRGKAGDLLKSYLDVPNGLVYCSEKTQVELAGILGCCVETMKKIPEWKKIEAYQMRGRQRRG